MYPILLHICNGRRRFEEIDVFRGDARHMIWLYHKKTACKSNGEMGEMREIANYRIYMIHAAHPTVALHPTKEGGAMGSKLAGAGRHRNRGVKKKVTQWW